MLQSIILALGHTGRGGGEGGSEGGWEGSLKSLVCSCCFVRVLLRVLTVTCHHGLLDITVTYFVCYQNCYS